MTPEDCTEVFARLSEYLDGDLANASCEEIERHIAGCAPCVQFVQSLRKSIQLTRGFDAGIEPGPLPDDVKENLRKAFEAAARRTGNP
jgi:anti-sigma factor RsiW